MLIPSLEKRVESFIKHLPKKHGGQIMRKVALLLADPYPSDSKLLKGIDMYRTDSGEYRIIYRVENTLLRVYLVGKRNDNDVYRRLDRLG